MTVWIDVLFVTVVAGGLLLYSGWGMTIWFVPTKLQNRLYLLVPFTGFFVIDALSHITSYANLPGYKSVWLLGIVATAINITAVVWRRSSWRLPNRFEWLIFLFALPAIPLTVTPMVPHGELLPVGDSSNADPISHTATTDWLQENGYQEPIEQGITLPVNGPIMGKVKSDVRIGFHFYQMYVDVLTGHKAYATFTIIAAISLYLWSIAAGFFAGDILATNEKTAFLTTFLFSISALPLWIAFGGYGPQFLGMGLLIMAFSLWTNALQTCEWRHMLFAAIFSAAFAGIYSDALPYIIAPVGLFGAMQLFISWKNGRFLNTLKISLLGAVTTLIVNPIGWYRAISRSLDIVQGGGGGNVDWWIDLRQVVGLIPFYKNNTYWFDHLQIQLLVIPAILLGIMALYGFINLNRSAKMIAISFLLPHIGSLIWLYQNNSTYKYFKGWSMGWFLYLSLIAVGFISLSLRQQVKKQKVGRMIGSLSIVITIVLLGQASIKLSHSMIDRIVSPPEIIELADWVNDLMPETNIFLSAGDLPRVSVFWIYYHLQNDHQLYVDKSIVYTQYTEQPYRGEAYAIRQINGTNYWNPPLWDTAVKERNASFELLEITPQGRVYELITNPTIINAQLGDVIQLVGYDADLTDLQPNDTFKITLYWQALAKMHQSYKVFIHLLSSDGNLWGQYDGIPQNWTYHTYLWQPGEFITDTYEITLDAQAPIGEYKVLVGIYQENTGERLPVVQNGQKSLDATIHLMSQTKVTESAERGD